MNAEEWVRDGLGISGHPAIERLRQLVTDPQAPWLPEQLEALQLIGALLEEQDRRLSKAEERVDHERTLQMERNLG